MRLICFAHAGAAASAFSTWHKQLPEQIEVYAVQLPGREARRGEPFARDFAKLVQQLQNVLAPLHDRPVALFGYSLGSLLAFEYARGIARDAEHLIVGAGLAPQRPIEPSMAHLSDAEFLRELDKRYDGIPSLIRTDPELLAYFLPVIRADLDLRSTYRYREQPPLACPITALGGSRDPRVTPDEVAHWRSQTSAAFSSHIYPGGHLFITSALSQVLSLISRTLIPAENVAELSSS
jgi:surfactin synthase thioesterase subunit